MTSEDLQSVEDPYKFLFAYVSPGVSLDDRLKSLPLLERILSSHDPDLLRFFIVHQEGAASSVSAGGGVDSTTDGGIGCLVEVLFYIKLCRSLRRVGGGDGGGGGGMGEAETGGGAGGGEEETSGGWWGWTKKLPWKKPKPKRSRRRGARRGRARGGGTRASVSGGVVDAPFDYVESLGIWLDCLALCMGLAAGVEDVVQRRAMLGELLLLLSPPEEGGCQDRTVRMSVLRILSVIMMQHAVAAPDADGEEEGEEQEGEDEVVASALSVGAEGILIALNQSLSRMSVPELLYLPTDAEYILSALVFLNALIGIVHVAREANEEGTEMAELPFSRVIDSAEAVKEVTAFAEGRGSSLVAEDERISKQVELFGEWIEKLRSGEIERAERAAQVIDAVVEAMTPEISEAAVEQSPELHVSTDEPPASVSRRMSTKAENAELLVVCTDLYKIATNAAIGMSDRIEDIIAVVKSYIPFLVDSDSVGVTSGSPRDLLKRSLNMTSQSGAEARRLRREREESDRLEARRRRADMKMVLESKMSGSTTTSGDGDDAADGDEIVASETETAIQPEELPPLDFAADDGGDLMAPPEDEPFIPGDDDGCLMAPPGEGLMAPPGEGLMAPPGEGLMAPPGSGGGGGRRRKPKKPRDPNIRYWNVDKIDESMYDGSVFSNARALAATKRAANKTAPDELKKAFYGYFEKKKRAPKKVGPARPKKVALIKRVDQSEIPVKALRRAYPSFDDLFAGLERYDDNRIPIDTVHKILQAFPSMIEYRAIEEYDGSVDALDIPSSFFKKLSLRIPCAREKIESWKVLDGVRGSISGIGRLLESTKEAFAALNTSSAFSEFLFYVKLVIDEFCRSEIKGFELLSTFESLMLRKEEGTLLRALVRYVLPRSDCCSVLVSELLPLFEQVEGQHYCVAEDGVKHISQDISTVGTHVAMLQEKNLSRGPFFRKLSKNHKKGCVMADALRKLNEEVKDHIESSHRLFCVDLKSLKDGQFARSLLSFLRAVKKESLDGQLELRKARCRSLKKSRSSMRAVETLIDKGNLLKRALVGGVKLPVPKRPRRPRPGLRARPAIPKPGGRGASRPVPPLPPRPGRRGGPVRPPARGRKRIIRRPPKRQ